MIYHSETIDVLPNSEYIAPARVENLLHEGGVVILESIPNMIEKHDVVVPKILVKVDSGTVPVRYLNLRDEHVKAFNGTSIATTETIAGIEHSVNNQWTNSGNVNVVKASDTEHDIELPSHLQPIFESKIKSIVDRISR